MADGLAIENRRFIKRMIREGRFHNESEVMRGALRRMEREENRYLNPLPLTEAEAKECFAANPAEDAKEHLIVRAAEKARKRRWRQSGSSVDDL